MVLDWLGFIAWYTYNITMTNFDLFLKLLLRSCNLIRFFKPIKKSCPFEHQFNLWCRTTRCAWYGLKIIHGRHGRTSSQGRGHGCWKPKCSRGRSSIKSKIRQIRSRRRRRTCSRRSRRSWHSAAVEFRPTGTFAIGFYYKRNEKELWQWHHTTSILKI